MSFFLFLDDERTPPKGWICARNLAEFKRLFFANGIPEIVSFDHDLGGDETGMLAIHWLIDQDIPVPEWRIHSANPEGRDNMEALLQNWRRHCLEQKLPLEVPPCEQPRKIPFL